MSDAMAATAYDVCEVWLSRCVDALSGCPDSEPLSAAYVAVGAIAWDTCCGVLVVAPERTYRTDEFPIEGETVDYCETFEIAVDVLVLLLRCVPTIDDRGNAPPVSEVIPINRSIITDGALIWNAVTGALPEGWMRSNVDQTYVGAEGGCIGVETRLTIGLPQDSWCPPCEEES